MSSVELKDLDNGKHYQKVSKAVEPIKTSNTDSNGLIPEF